MTKREEPAVETPNEEEDFFSDSTRARLYEEIDKLNAGGKTSVVFGEKDQPKEETAPAAEASEGTEPAPETEGEGPAAEEAAPVSEEVGTVGEGEEEAPVRKVVSRAEFMEIFKDFTIKDKVAGEEVEAPVGEWIKATGLEKHYTKRLQELSRREREVLSRSRDQFSSTPEGEGIPGVPDEEEIEEKYNELYGQSPFRAKQYLESIENARDLHKKVQEKARVDKAVADFKSSYPECTDADWDRMNDPAFWSKHEDVVAFRESGDVFATLVTAYTRLAQSQVTSKPAKAGTTTEPKVDKVTRKKEGQVIRTTNNPPPRKAAPTKSKAELDRDYIAARRAEARARMRIPD